MLGSYSDGFLFECLNQNSFRNSKLKGVGCFYMIKVIWQLGLNWDLSGDYDSYLNLVCKIGRFWSLFSGGSSEDCTLIDFGVCLKCV